MEAIDVIGVSLLNENNPLPLRFRALFALRNLEADSCVDWIGKCFDDESALLKHECAYCLGQMQNDRAVPILISVLENVHEHPMVRHEAGEALGAIGSPVSLPILKKYTGDVEKSVAETCQLAVKRVEWLSSNKDDTNLPDNPYHSVDPMPPCEESNVDKLKDMLLDETQCLHLRYRAMFSLRNVGGEQAVSALAQGLKCDGALFRHEIAYVLGQMQHEAAVLSLANNLKDLSEDQMVRHECAEALGSIATPDCYDILRGFLTDQQRVVRESCEVALDMYKHETSGEFQYADTSTTEQPVPV